MLKLSIYKKNKDDITVNLVNLIVHLANDLLYFFVYAYYNNNTEYNYITIS